MNIADTLKRLNRAEVTDPEQDCSAADLSAAVCNLLDEILLVDDIECDKFGDWVDGIRKLRCEIIGEHHWMIDQCGYWGHTYCTGCNSAKYPELAVLSCADAKAKIGDIEETEHVAP